MIKTGWIVMLAACGGGNNNPDASVLADAHADAKLVDAAPDAPPDAMPAFTFTKTKVGEPAWTVTDPFQFAARLGNIADNFVEAHTTLQIIIPHHEYNAAQNIWATKDAHQPPYDIEESDLLPNAAFKLGTTFALADWQPLNGIGVALTVIPSATAPTGGTPDGTLPMIPNTVLPLDNGADLYRSGVLVDPNFDGFFPLSTTWAPGTDGYSHIHMFFLENTEYLNVTTQKGTYSWRFRLRDTTGAGWDLTAGPLYVH